MGIVHTIQISFEISPVVKEVDKPIACAHASCLVSLDLDFRYCAHRAEHILQLVFCDIWVEIAHV